MDIFLHSDNVERSTALIKNTPRTLEPGTSQLREGHLIIYSQQVKTFDLVEYEKTVMLMQGDLQKTGYAHVT